MDRRSIPTCHSVEFVRGNRAKDDSAFVDPRDDIENHLAPLRAFARVLAQDIELADGLVEDTVVKAWTDIDRFEPGTNMRAWLFTILRAIHYARCRNAVRKDADHEDIIAEWVSEQCGDDSAPALGRFRRAFDVLSDVQREALILIGAAGFSPRDAAAICGCTTGTIRNRDSLGRRKLAEIVSLEKGEAGMKAEPARMEASR